MYRPVKPAIVDQDYTLTSAANDDLKRFDLELRSNSSRSLCISGADWPNKLGQVSGGSERAKVVYGSREISSRDTNFGSCVGESCTVKIKPRSLMRGFISYNEFEESSGLSEVPEKRLIYQIKPYFC